MPATVTIRRWTGTTGAPVKNDITSINTRLNAEDTHSTAGTSNPVRIPAAGTNYSYWASTRLNATTTPAGTINNIKWFTDGANNLGTGLGCNANTGSAYSQAVGTPGTTGTGLTKVNYDAGGGTLAADPTNVFAFTAGAPLSVTGSLANPSTGDFGDFVVFQITVGSTAIPGASAQESFTWRYDET